MKCPMCGEETQEGRLVGLKQIRWFPLPKDRKRFGIYVNKLRKVEAMGCEGCGYIMMFQKGVGSAKAIFLGS